MSSRLESGRRGWRLIALILLVASPIVGDVYAQTDAPGRTGISEAGPSGVDPATLQDLAAAAAAPKTMETSGSQGIDILSLLLKGGIFMIPIAIVSLMVVMFIFERLIALRAGKLTPRALIRKLQQQSRESESLDPRIAYEYCGEHPSALANVVRAVLGGPVVLNRN